MNKDENAIIRVSGEVIESGAASRLELAGQAANAAASANLFADYRQRKSASTLRAHDAALALFAEYLGDAGVTVSASALASEPATWRGVGWGLVKGFVQWQLNGGYAVSSINARLSHVKVYVRMANQAGAVAEGEMVKIDSISGFSGAESVHVNGQRREQGKSTRIGAKKTTPVVLDDDQAFELMHGQPDTAQGRRDALLVHLALKHGLRVSEMAALQVGDVTLTRKGGKVVSGVIRFYRPKVAGTDQEWGEHIMTNSTLKAMAAYLDTDAPAVGPLLRASRKGGELTSAGMSKRSISFRIKSLGKAVGAEGLTAHDCRHYAATRDGKRGKSVRYLLDKFGWTSATTAMRYVKSDGPVVVD